MVVLHISNEIINSIFLSICCEWVNQNIVNDFQLKCYCRGARHGLSLSGKLSRINAQDQQMLGKMSISTETAQDIFKDWITVKKKRKNRKEKKTKTIEADTNISATHNTNDQAESSLPKTPESDTCNGLIDQNDYKINNKSRKKKRQHRERDEDLAESLSKLKTGETSLHSSSLRGVCNSSKAIKKENSKRSKTKKNHRNSSMHQTNVKNESKVGMSAAKKIRSKKSKDQSSAILLSDDRLAHQIGEIMEKHPNKKFKVVSEQLTKHQKKSLRKSGLRVELKSKKKKKDEKKKLKEQSKFDEISKKLEKSLLLDD